MKIYGYGEDALTFWAISRKLNEILAVVGDSTPAESTVVFFRPSFGRSGGSTNSQFGEFDFVIATPSALHLGEVKWQNSPETAQAAVALRPEQIERHKILAAYYTLWISRDKWDWEDYSRQCIIHFSGLGIQKPVPPSGSLLSKNLHHILKVLSETTLSAPTVNNILLIVKTDADRLAPIWQPPHDFHLAVLDATGEIENNFLPLHFIHP